VGVVREEGWPFSVEASTLWLWGIDSGQRICERSGSAGGRGLGGEDARAVPSTTEIMSTNFITWDLELFL
jgi:hypothetical protein